MARKSFSFGEVLGFGWHTMKANFWFLVGVVAASGIICLLPSAMMPIMKLLPFLFFVIPAVDLIINIVIGIGFIKITLSFCDGQKPRFRTLFDGWDCFWRCLGTGLLYGLTIVGVSLVMFLLADKFKGNTIVKVIIPVGIILSVILMLRFSFCYHFAIDKGLGPINALRASSRTAKGVELRLLGFYILCSLIHFLGALCFLVGMFATFPMVMIAITLVYRQLLAQVPKLPEFNIGSVNRQASLSNRAGLGIRLATDFQPSLVIQPKTKVKNSKYSSWIIMLGFTVLILAAATYYFWPTLKGSWSTVKNVVAMDNSVSLTGIFYAEDNRAAIVGGKVVHEGDVVEGVKIVKIDKNKVEFERSGEKWSQQLRSVEEGVHSSLPLLLQLGSHKCPPCRQMKPILEELKAKYADEFQVRYIDVWADKTAGAEYEVRAIPTQIFYDSKRRELFRHTGFLPKEDILNTWKQLGFEF